MSRLDHTGRVYASAYGIELWPEPAGMAGARKAWCGRMGEFAPPVVTNRSIAIAGRDTGKLRPRPGLYQCSSGDCRFQFTVTTHTPLHSTKLPLRVWLKAMWLMLQSDKGLSSVRLAEALGVSQPTAWRMGHALRLMVARAHMLDGTVTIDNRPGTGFTITVALPLHAIQQGDVLS